MQPENIFFSLNGSIKIGDFGTVTEHGSQIHSGDKKCKNIHKNNVTHTDGIGTDGYRAPELEGTHYDYKVDIFSLGVILYELITPFHTEEERFDAIDQLRNSPFPKNCDTNFNNEVNVKERLIFCIIIHHLVYYACESLILLTHLFPVAV